MLGLGDVRTLGSSLQVMQGGAVVRAHNGGDWGPCLDVCLYYNPVGRKCRGELWAVSWSAASSTPLEVMHMLHLDAHTYIGTCTKSDEAAGSAFSCVE